LFDRDVESCDPMKPFENTIYQKEFSASREIASIVSNIDTVIKNFFKTDIEAAKSSAYACKKMVFYSDEVVESNAEYQKYVKELQRHEYEKMACAKKTGVVLLMRGDFTVVIH